MLMVGDFELVTTCYDGHLLIEPYITLIMFSRFKELKIFDYKQPSVIELKPAA